MNYCIYFLYYVFIVLLLKISNSEVLKFDKVEYFRGKDRQRTHKIILQATSTQHSQLTPIKPIFKEANK